MLRLISLLVLPLFMAACSDYGDAPGNAGIEPDSPPAMNVVSGQSAQLVVLDMYTSPTCGCCSLWADHLEERGFRLVTHYPADLASFKSQQKILPNVQSCHTAVSAEGYLFEGHVPARYMLEFLANPPAGARGLAVPAMPVGSPGMEMGERFTPYEVLLLSEDGGTEVFARVTEPEQQYVTY